MSLLEIAGLITAAAAAGAVNAVAGGGTLLTFPTLLAFGTPAIIANATSTVALVLGTSGSVFGFRRYLPVVKSLLWRFVPVSVAGGLLGGMLLTATSERTFAKLVPFLILFATILFLSQRAIRNLRLLRAFAATHTPGQRLWLAIFFQFAVAVYGGYFGAGIGILMLASLGFMGLSDIHEMNTVKTVLGSLINVVAAAWFIASGLVHWQKAGVMTVGAVAGYYLGAHFSQRISQPRVRQIITAVGFGISVITFYKEFAR